jgi:hypothetical protein
MSNVSFARIMYGTNENVRGTAKMNASGFSASANFAAPEKDQQPSLQGLLHKAWLILSSKS